LIKIGKPRTTKGLATFCAKIALEKHASMILLLNLNKTENAPADYFVICGCQSDIQIKSITDELIKKCREFDIPKPKIEGLQTGYWVVVDFFDVVMHIMMPEARQFYKLEKLWGDAQFKTIDDSGNPKTFNTKDLKY
jgi:ribosome-associated protein